ncbi:phenolic acid decarboxylase [Pseudomonas koreensis]|uniref:phenolic acid decarboxylase n=1 Tax=Pseudomonas koreensis TaxID=198620 RepID=UPI003C6E872C
MIGRWSMGNQLEKSMLYIAPGIYKVGWREPIGICVSLLFDLKREIVRGTISFRSGLPVKDSIQKKPSVIRKFLSRICTSFVAGGIPLCCNSRVC